LKHRVHDLAKELGVPSKEILAKLSELGEFVKSVSSTVEAPVVKRLREIYGISRPRARTSYNPPPPEARPTGPRPRIANSPFGRRSTAPIQPDAFSLPPPKAKSKGPRREWHRGDDPSEFQRMVLEVEILPRREWSERPMNIPEGRYFEDEVKEARDVETRWREAVLFLTLPEIEDWMRLVPGAPMRAALKFHNAGMTARDANLRLWYGKLNPGRQTLFEQVTHSSLTISDAAKWVHQYRNSEHGGGASRTAH
jgi:hypothetical protein